MERRPVPGEVVARALLGAVRAELVILTLRQELGLTASEALAAVQAAQVKGD